MKKATERWAWVVGYKGYYRVSTKGRVRSVSRHIERRGGRSQFCKGRLLKTQLNEDGYIQVGLYGNGRRQLRCTVHLLVARAFIANPDGLPEVDHVDGDKTNNCVGNLEWVTSSENTERAFALGLRVASGCAITPIYFGSNNGMAKLSDAVVVEIRRRYARGGISQRVLGEQFGVKQCTISDVVRRRIWKHVV